MKRKITFLLSALFALTLITIPQTVLGQSDFSETYTSNVSFTSNATITIDEVDYDAAKCGTSNSAGSITFSVPANSNYLHFHIVGWNGKTVKIKIEPTGNATPNTNISVTSNSVISGSGTTFEITASEDYYKVISLSNVTTNTNFTITATSGNRFVIWGINTENYSTTPTITVSPTSLTGFTYSHGNGPSEAQSFTVSGANLTDDLSITAPDDYELRQGTTGDFGNSISLAPSTGTVSSTTIYARLKADQNVGTYNSENVTLTSTGATGKTVALSGSVTGYTLTYSGNGNTGGTVPTDATAYEKGASVTILGNTGSLVKTHYSFGGWTRNIGGAPKTYAAGDTLIIKANTTVNAVWAPITHTFSTAVTPNNSGTVVAKDGGNNTIASGSSVAETAQLTLTASPAEGYNFTSWSDGGNNSTLSSTTTNPTTFTMGTANVTVTATFTARTPATVTLNHGEGGNTSTVVNTYADATVADLGSPATVNGWTTMGWVLSYTSGEPELLSTSTVIDDIDDANHELTLYAVYKKGSNTFTKITNTNDLAVDGTYMICGYGGSSYYLMADAGTNVMNRTTSITITNNTFEYSVGKKFVLGGTSGAYTFYDGSKYLTTESSSNSSLLTLTDELGDYGKWSISFTNTGVVQITKYNASRYVSYYHNSESFNCYTSTNTVYLFKQTSNDLQITTAPLAEKCTVTYDANGGTGTVPTDDTQYNIGASVTVAAGTGLTKTGYSFNGWNTAANGTGTSHAAGSTFNINENTTLYAQWTIQSYNYTLTVTGVDNGATAVLKVDDENVAQNAQIQYNKEVTIVVTLSDADAYAYRLSVVNNTTTEPVSVSNNKFNMPASAVTVTVTTEENPYQYAELTGDDMSTMTNKGTGYGTTSTTLKYKTVNGFYWEANAYQQGNTPKYLQINTPGDNTATGSYIKLPVFNGKIEEIVCTVSSSNRYLYFNTTNNTTNTIATGGNGSASTTKTIDMTNVCYQTGYIVSSGSIQITNIRVKYRPYQDMTGNTISSIDDDVTVSIPSGSVSANNLTIPASSGIIIKSGATLTVSGTLTNDGNANNIIIEEGGQLICSNSVAATIKKNITASTAGAKSGEGWYTISSPVHDGTDATLDVAHVTNLVSSTADGFKYDMFSYDENTHTWLNQKVSTTPGHESAGFTTMTKGQGYLYRSTGQPLSFIGNTNAGAVDCPLIWSSSEEDLKGFNLIGNPYPHSITKGVVGAAIYDADHLAAGYYVMSNAGGWTACDDGTEIESKQGILVKTSAAVADFKIKDINYEAPAPGKANNDNIKFVVANSQYEDVAYARFDKGIGLNKISHRNADIPMLYINQNDEDYAIAMMSDDIKAFNLNFKAMTTSQYTLSLKSKGNYSYLHLIDRLTGKDIDLLLDNEYTFIGSPKDADNRFLIKLNYDGGNSTSENEIFAYQSGNEIIVNGEGELQIFDVTGRQVMNTTINGVESINIPNQGVYIFRLNEKVQKIVVR